MYRTILTVLILVPNTCNGAHTLKAIRRPADRWHTARLLLLAVALFPAVSVQRGHCRHQQRHKSSSGRYWNDRKTVAAAVVVVVGGGVALIL